jgi:hypothetical protein
METHQDITTCFMSTLQDPTRTFLANSSPFTARAAVAQDRIGWYNFMEGKLALEWRELQDTYYRTTSSNRYGKRWSMYTIQEVLGVTHAQWDTRCKLAPETYKTDAQGLPLNEGVALTEAINTMLQTDPATLLAGDQSLLSRRTPEQLHRLSPTNKATWLHSMRLAKEIAAEERVSDAAGMRNVMRQWLDQPD